ncbi:2821_t:CDS:1, partial [Rhizophagus irregularis]
LEDFDMTVLPMGSVIGSELENFNVSKYPLLTQPVELVVSSRFSF